MATASSSVAMSSSKASLCSYASRQPPTPTSQHRRYTEEVSTNSFIAAASSHASSVVTDRRKAYASRACPANTSFSTSPQALSLWMR